MSMERRYQMGAVIVLAFVGLVGYSRAEAFRAMPPAEACKKHPELVGAYATMAAVAKQAEAHGLNPQQQSVVMGQAKQNMAANIEKGHIPEVKVREEQQVSKDKDLVR